ncbi:effector binding domain-containing protein [Foetidibacter luteolus]|uniref:effector binding domain-containing protein n=1 Tax=Foetidibacter luteolus TaxID=2608880 RepID=UPI00129AA5D5|nr:GyrI-like domain-containing protein [Foetidibacter luteolus]
MQITAQPPVTALYFSTQTTLSSLAEHISTVAQLLYAECLRLQLWPAGPIHWIYYEADGNPQTVFMLEIALPVDGTPNGETAFPVKQLPAFTCAVTEHRGNWAELGKTYGSFVPQVLHAGHKLNGQTRELYINIDFNQPENNITQVQVGVE